MCRAAADEGERAGRPDVSARTALTVQGIGSPEANRLIAELVADGRSNRAIAEALVLSERTVESHVRRLLAKLQLTTRTELVRWFLQRPT